MADEIRNGQAEYGIRHVNEEEMREKGLGVYANKARTSAPDNKSLTSMTKAELLDTARVEGVDVESDDTKADLIRKIEKARK